MEVLSRGGDGQTTHGQLVAGSLKIGDGLLGLARVDAGKPDQAIRMVGDVGGHLLIGDLGLKVLGLETEHDRGIDRFGGGDVPGRRRPQRVLQGLREGSVLSVKGDAPSELLGRFPCVCVTVYDHEG